MASRIMHLAIAEQITKEIRINDINRFRIGCVLPDACESSAGRKITHYQTKLTSEGKITYLISDFRKKYKELILSDDLYLGYYIHLIEDIFFRHFVYVLHSWNPFPEGNVARLHNDYRLLNTYLIEKHSLTNTISLPEDIKKETVFSIYPFCTDKLITDIKNDFIPYYEGIAFFFTKDMADDYTEFSIVKCIKEIKALKTGLNGLDEREWAWTR